MRYRYREEHEMKDSGVEWIGKIPKETNIVKLKHNSHFINGYAFKSEDLKIENKIPVIRIGDIRETGLEINRMLKVHEDLITNLNMYKVKDNDILIAMSGATVGKTMYIRKKINALINQRVGIIRAKEINSKFLYYNINNSKFKSEILLSSAGGAQENISSENIRDKYIIQISDKEQEKIANFLDEKTSQFDLIISKKEELIQRLEEAKKSLISEVVTGKVKVVKSDDGYELVKRSSEEMKDSGVEWLGEIPKDWNITKLKYIGEAITGLTYSPNDIVDENEGTLVLRSSNVQNGRIVLNDNVYVNMNIPKKLITKEGDIIICSRNGSRALIGKNACIGIKESGKSFGAFMTVFRSKYYEYLSFVFNSHIFKAQSGSFLTSTINQLTIGNLNSFIVAIPNEKEQYRIVKYLYNKTLEYNCIIDKVKVQTQKLKEAKQSLISEAVTGKIEILD